MTVMPHQPINPVSNQFVFNHFPKAGGTSFFAILKQHIAESAISPQLMEQEIRLARPERFEHYRLIRGHFSLLTQMGFSRARYSMTLLRDPIRTIFSAYNFWRNRAEEDSVSAQAKRTSFAEFVRRFADSPTIINNTYTHHFAAVSRDYPGEPSDPGLLLAYARHNLAAFNFVGICEQFEESVRLLCHNLGWAQPARMPHENRSQSAQSLENLDFETRQILLDRNRLDLQLYDYAKALFVERCARAQGEPFPPGGMTPSPEGDSSDTASGGNRFLAYPIPPGAWAEARIRQVAAQWAAQPPGNRVEVTIAYGTRVQLRGLMAGIMIFNAEGVVQFGTNTWIENAPLRHEPGADCRVTFEMECGLAPGIYSVTAALGDFHRPGFHFDWVDRAALFQVEERTDSPAGMKGLKLIGIDSVAGSITQNSRPVAQ